MRSQTVTERKKQASDRKGCGGEPEQASGTSTVVFYGDPQLVSDAFALALDAIDTSAVVLTAGAVAARPKTSDS
jgi:hypothetical protein